MKEEIWIFFLKREDSPPELPRGILNFRCYRFKWWILRRKLDNTNKKHLIGEKRIYKEENGIVRCGEDHGKIYKCKFLIGFHLRIQLSRWEYSPCPSRFLRSKPKIRFPFLISPEKKKNMGFDWPIKNSTLVWRRFAKASSKGLNNTKVYRPVWLINALKSETSHHWTTNNVKSESKLLYD